MNYYYKYLKYRQVMNSLENKISGKNLNMIVTKIK